MTLSTAYLHELYVMFNKFFPGLAWLEGYSSVTFKHDLLSGIAIAFMLIPQGMAYALVAGLPPEYGLYACVFPPIMYAMLGTSNKISIGPVALDAILIITGLSMLAEPGSDRYLQLLVMLTLLVGLIQCLFGLIGFGFISNFLSHPVIVGYTGAAALIIIGSQMESMLGLNVVGGNVFELGYQLLNQASDIHWLTLATGCFALAFMLLPKKLFLGMPAALILLITGMFLSGSFNAESKGIDVISSIPQGMPSLFIPDISLSDFGRLLPVALTVALMGFVGTMSICKMQEKPSDKVRTNPNQELTAIGASNICGAFFRALPVSASFSRSAAFRDSGALTQVSALVSSGLIILVLLYVSPIFLYFPLPKVLLSAIIIISVSSLFKYSQMKNLFSQSKREFLILMVTFFITLLLGVQQGLIAGVVLSILMVIYNTANPHMIQLGSIQDGRLFRNIKRFENAVVREDILIFRFDAPLYFANKDYFVSKIYQWIKQREGGQLTSIIFDAEAVNSLDSTALLALEKLIENLKTQNIRFYLSNAIGPVRDSINQSDLSRFMVKGSMFATIQDAIVYIDGGVLHDSDDALQTNN
jgi:SulP family sulfate permease